MKRISLNFTEITYKKDDLWDVLFDDDWNSIIEKTEIKNFNLTINLDENITVKQMSLINQCFKWITEGEEIEGIKRMLNEFAIEKENIVFIDKLWLSEFEKLNNALTEIFNKITETTQKKMLK